MFRQAFLSRGGKGLLQRFVQQNSSLTGATVALRTSSAAVAPSSFIINHPQKYYLSTKTTSSDRPFRVLGVQQIALGSTDKDGLNKLWFDIFGLQPTKSVTLERENVSEDILQVGASKSPYKVEIDLMVPIDENKSPKVHVPPLNHFGLWIDNLEEAVKWMKNNGVRFAGGIRPGAAGHNIAFIHPKGNEDSPIGGNGVLIELVQAPPEVIDAYNKDS